MDVSPANETLTDGLGVDKTVIVAVLIGAVPILCIIARQIRIALAGAGNPELLPEDGIFTMASLSRFDGQVNPLFMGVCGEVVNCSASENIRHGEGYGRLWAGRDATYSLATLSLKPEDANRLDFKLSDFTADQHKALAGWYKHFTTKYEVVGVLKEYDGWDWGTVHAEAKFQRPFGAAAEVPEGGRRAGELPALDATALGGGGNASTSTRRRQDPVVLSRGDRIMVRDPESEFYEQEGSLVEFKPDHGTFEVRLDKTGESACFRPQLLRKL